MAPTRIKNNQQLLATLKKDKSLFLKDSNTLIIQDHDAIEDLFAE
jgi:hypothetical protein